MDLLVSFLLKGLFVNRSIAQWWVEVLFFFTTDGHSGRATERWEPDDRNTCAAGGWWLKWGKLPAHLPELRQLTCAEGNWSGTRWHSPHFLPAAMYNINI